MTSIFNASTRSLVEQPELKPKRPFAANYDNQEDFDLDLQHYNFIMEGYNAHLSSLRTIPVQGEHKWRDGHFVTEGVHYNVESVCGYHKSDCTGNRHCEDCRLVAIPIKVSDEDLWEELLEDMATDMTNEQLKSKYIITKR